MGSLNYWSDRERYEAERAEGRARGSADYGSGIVDNPYTYDGDDKYRNLGWASGWEAAEIRGARRPAYIGGIEAGALGYSDAANPFQWDFREVAKSLSADWVAGFYDWHEARPAVTLTNKIAGMMRKRVMGSLT